MHADCSRVQLPVAADGIEVKGLATSPAGLQQVTQLLPRLGR